MDGLEQFLNSSQCDRRNKHAALVGGVEATPVRFFGQGGFTPLTERAKTEKGSASLLHKHGTLPTGDTATADALKLINAMLPPGAPDLTEEQVFIHYCEAANSGLIPDRYGFLDSQTLLNIAQCADLGRSFMNNHRTGDMCSPSELPFGKTFVGQYEQVLSPGGKVIERATLGFYMLKGMSPNGANGPTTDDFSRLISGGVLSDVSVGLWPGLTGKTICNVCDQSLRTCDHYPGTNRGMELADMERSRDVYGVPTGVATYRLSDWVMGEVSGVYDGAIPGAGFAKGYGDFKAGKFSSKQAEQFEAAFAALLRA